jgi:glutathione S-transferase
MGDRHMFGATVPPVFTEIGAMMPPSSWRIARRCAPTSIRELLASSPISERAPGLAAGLDRTLARGGFLLGERFGLADASSTTCSGSPGTRRASSDPRAFPGVQRWLAAIDAMGQASARR